MVGCGVGFEGEADGLIYIVPRLRAEDPTPRVFRKLELVGS